LGANDVIDYKSQTFENIVHDYDAVFDTVGDETYTRSFRVLKYSILEVLAVYRDAHTYAVTK
jgi:NADPH:quinone reductase-like Zn-dependent oxidoreductase